MEMDIVGSFPSASRQNRDRVSSSKTDNISDAVIDSNDLFLTDLRLEH